MLSLLVSMTQNLLPWLVKQHQSDQDLGNDSSTVLLSNPKFSGLMLDHAPSVEPRKLELVLPVKE